MSCGNQLTLFQKVFLDFNGPNVQVEAVVLHVFLSSFQLQPMAGGLQAACVSRGESGKHCTAVCENCLQFEPDLSLKV